MEARGQAGIDDAWPEPVARFQSWAEVLFGFLIVAWLIGCAMIAGSSDIRPLGKIMAGLGAVLTIAVSLTIIWALSRHRLWALEATVWICGLLVVSGLVRGAFELARGGLPIPLDVVAALLVLNRRPRRPAASPLRRGSRAATGAVAAYTLGILVWWFAGEAARGAFLGTSADSVDVTVDVACADVASDPDGAITIDTRWRWRATEPFPGATDGLVVSWFGEGNAFDPSIPAFYVEAVATDPANGIWQGGGSPSSELIGPIAALGPSEAFGIDVDEIGMRDGGVTVTLRPSSPAAPRGSITVVASYAHLDWWVRQSELVECRW